MSLYDQSSRLIGVPLNTKGRNEIASDIRNQPESRRLGTEVESGEYPMHHAHAGDVVTARSLGAGL